MTLRQRKIGTFTLEGLNAFATSLYFYYLFFFTQEVFGFGNLRNLCLAALNGLIYMLLAWFGGRFGQRHGYYKSLRVGFSILAVSLLFGGTAHSQALVTACLALWTFGLCFTWPTLEALASEGEDAVGLQRMVGIYNLVWSGASALAYFSGGFLIEKLGPHSIFWIPLSIHVLQLAIVHWLEGRKHETTPALARAAEAVRMPKLNPRPIARARAFLQMAWWANPFAYVAINTVAAVVPSLARKLSLEPMVAGFCCSVWLFARMLTFLVLWRWTGWQYRLRWFIGAYVLLGISFAAVLLSPRLAPLLLAQVTLGFAVGLLYYSSLYYSMDVGEAKGENGGMHESTIGAGLCAGPTIGAAALRFLPDYPNSGALAVSIALGCGLIGLVILSVRWNEQRRAVRTIS